MAAIGLSMALTSAAGAAKAFQASASFSVNQPSGIPIFIDLPQYSGPGTITSVVLSLSGVAGGDNFYPYLLDEGITVASGPASWDVLLQGPDFALVADAPIHTQFVGGTIAPCTDPACEATYGDAIFGPKATSFSVSGGASDLLDFAGTGIAEILIFDSSSYDTNTLSGTLTETITTSVPEPSVWLDMLLGFGLVGAALRGYRAPVRPTA
jgi:hypothetical protein